MPKHLNYFSYMITNNGVCVCVCVWTWPYVCASSVYECLQESVRAINGLNTGKNSKEMQFINFSDNTTLPRLCNSCVNCAACSSLIDWRDVWWFEVICAFWERERAMIHSHRLWRLRNFSNYFISYLIIKKELYKIIIISPAPDKRRCRCMSCQSSHGRHVISLRSFVVFWCV